MIILPSLLLLGIILLLYGIFKNERIKARPFHRMPGGKAILSALAIFVVYLIALFIKQICHIGL